MGGQGQPGLGRANWGLTGGQLLPSRPGQFLDSAEAVIESNAVWHGRDRLAGVPDPDSGGFTWYVAPGLQWVTRRTVLEAAVQVPVVKNTNGLGLREDFTGRLSLRVSF